MQVKVLYSFDNSSTVFLSRSKNQYSVKVVQLPVEDTDEEMLLGAFDLRSCVQQIVRSSPENFKLQCEDYAVYYKDITEQPDEPFVANGVMSGLLSGSKQDLIPGRVCQNLSASFLFGDKANGSSLTLEIRLKLHVIDRSDEPSKEPEPEKATRAPSISIAQQLTRRRRPQSNPAVKATRTKSLPIFYHPPNQQISNIINADKLNATPRYDNKSIQERFNLAPFFSSAKIIDKPARKRRRTNVPLTPTMQTPGGSHPQRAVRTRSMITNLHTIMSSPITEDALSEATDDTEYNDNHGAIDEEDEEDDDYDMNGNSSSPYTPQQPPYKPSKASALLPTDGNFQSLPDLEDLDSKKTHTIPSTKLPADHDLICINRNCVASDSVTWRYFETKFRPSYLNIQRAKTFDKKLYDGMFGPLCNACYLFLRNKGFMRPEAVVKKYLQQQKYKKELKLKEDSAQQPSRSSSPLVPMVAPAHKFATPSHVPSAINEVIKNQNGVGVRVSQSASTSSVLGQTPGNDDYQDLNDFMTQLTNFGGPLTDIDLPHDLQLGVLGSTPPMMATKSNTRVINLYDDEEDKENCPPSVDKLDFEQMIKSLSLKSSPERNDWSLFFGEPTPKDNTPHIVSKTPSGDAGLPQLRVFRSSPGRLNNLKAEVVNMPSSPLLSNFDLDKRFTDSSPGEKATRIDTTMSYVNARKSSPHSELYLDEVKY